MDGARFDDLARALARPASRRTALAALAGLLPAVAVAFPAGAKRRRGCRPRCGEGFVCDRRECVCPSGVVCEGACCGEGQACEDGICITPEPPPACIPAGEPCKGLGRACCDGLTCASGQGGQADVACYAPAGGACAASEDCVYGALCRDGRCVATVTPRCTVCPENCPHATIEGAVADPGFPVVTVAAGVYRPVPADDALESRLVIRRSVTVEACGDGTVTIDGERTHRVVRIVDGEDGPPTVTLRNLVIANGDAAGGPGGGICLEQGSLVLDGVTVRDSAAYAGGGVYAASSTSLAITGASQITGNVAAGSGGGVHADGESTVEIGGSTQIRGNTSGAQGGGVYKTPVARLTIRDRAAVTGNDAADRGGGIESPVAAGAIPVVCAGAPTVCQNTASCPEINCEGAFDASCGAVCCTANGNGRGPVAAAC